MGTYDLTDEQNPDMVECPKCGCWFNSFVCDECPDCEEEQTRELEELSELRIADLSIDPIIMSMLMPGRLE